MKNSVYISPTDKPPIVLILGMHRSGTSLAAQLLFKWGAFMGKELYGADDNNQDGYWEHKQLNILNNKILTSIGCNWDTPPNKKLLQQIDSEYISEAKALIKEMDFSRQVWCWKDPRMVILWDFWKPLFKDRNITAVISYRQPNAVAASLKKRDQFTEEKSYNLWYRYNKDILKIRKEITRDILIEYETINTSPDLVCEQLFLFLNSAFHIEKSSFILQQMIDIIKPNINHIAPTQTYLTILQQPILNKLRLLNVIKTNQKLISRVQNIQYQIISKVFHRKIIDEQNKNLKLNMEQKVLQMKIQDLAYTNNKLEEKFNNNVIKTTQLVNQLDSARETIKNQENQIAKLIEYKNDFQQLKEKLTITIDQNNLLQKRIDAFQNSISYRILNSSHKMLRRIIMSPLRKIYREILNFRYTYKIKSSGLFDPVWYISNNPDVAKLKISAAKHYLIHGGFEERNPSPYFNSKNYLQANPDVKNAGFNPLLHYISHGKSENRLLSTLESNDINPNYQDPPNENRKEEEINRIRKSNLFDENYYYENYHDIKNAQLDPVRHYYLHGWKEGRNPSKTFNTLEYLAQNHELSKNHINPLMHFILNLNHDLCTIDESVSETAQPLAVNTEDLNIKTIAFYLPQFHPFKENNTWWGEGFTEWTNVTSAKPQFQNHYQPQLPGPLGFYDLRLIDTLVQQAKMAKEFGIYGFCFHHYYFAGKRLMEIPVDNLLKHPQIDLPFCLCWANENWTRRWDGLENDILIAQNHTPEDDVMFLEDIERYFLDKRYIRVENKPVLIIYKANQFPDLPKTIQRWRNYWRNKWNEELHLVLALTFGETNPLKYGFDAAVEFPPHNIAADDITHQKNRRNDFEGKIYSYQSFMKKSIEEKNENFALYKTIFPEWDNTARRGKNATIFADGTVKDYQKWLSSSINHAQRKLAEQERFVFINAWNEWAEGAHLEPCLKYGYKFLNATARILEKQACNYGPKVSVIVPNYNHRKYLHKRLDSIYHQTYKNFEVILLDDNSSDDSQKVLQEYASKYPEITRTIFNKTNSGSVFKQWNKGIKNAIGELIWIAESDDFCDYNFLQQMVINFTDESVLLAFSDCVFVSEDGIPLKSGGFHDYVNYVDTSKWKASYVATAHNEVSQALGIINTIPNASGVVFRKPDGMALLDDKDWQQMKVCGDWYFYLHIIAGGKIAFDTSTNNYFRRYESSTSASNYKNQLFFEEISATLKTMVSLYDIPNETLEKSKGYFWNLYQTMVNKDQKQFEDWFDISSIQELSAQRVPTVMITLYGFYPGGAEIMPIRLANELKRNNIPVTLLSCNGCERNKEIRALVLNSIPVLETESTSNIKKLIQDFGIDIINSHHWHFQQMHHQTENLLGTYTKHIATLHGMIESNNGDYQITDGILKKVDNEVSLWIYTADKNIEAFKMNGIFRKNPSKFIKIPNGVEQPEIKEVSRKELGIPEDAFVLCTVSRAIPDKGWLETIEAVKLARKKSNKDIRLILVGDGPVYDALINKDLPEYIHLQGFDKRSIGFYASADMGIMLSKFKSESFPLTIIDCLFAGKPFISTNIGEIKNILADGDITAGKVIELKNWEIQIKTAAETIVEFASDSEKYYSALQTAKNINKKYAIENVAKKYCETYLDIFKDHLPRKLIKKVNIQPVIVPENRSLETSIIKEEYGYCPICEKETTFRATDSWLRDHYKCLGCDSIPRQRHLLHVLNKICPDWKNKKTHESSPTNNLLNRLSPNYTSSYYFPKLRSGLRKGNIQNENLEQLSFKNDSFDIFITQDVLEHVFNPKKALQEMYRVIKPNGFIIFTVPISYNQKTEQRAEILSDNTINHIMPPVYHGNPIDNNGSLVTWDYGNDFLSVLRQWLPLSRINVFNNPIPKHGIEGEFLDVFVIEKIEVENIKLNNDTFKIWNNLSNREWYEKLLMSVKTNSIDGVKVGFPPVELQAQLTGRSNQGALHQAFQFYLRVKYYAEKYRGEILPEDKICDFACGWGRITRFFLKDVYPNNLTGLDSIDRFIKLDSENIPSINFKKIPPTPPYSISDKFDIICAFSLFSHLKSEVAFNILKELHGLLSSNGIIVFTSRGHHFINYCENLRIERKNKPNHTERQMNLYEAFTPYEDSLEKYRKGEFQFYNYPNSPNNNYGEAIMPKEWVLEKLSSMYELIGFENENLENDLDQTIIALKKKG